TVNAGMRIHSIVASESCAQMNNSGTSLAAGANCTVNVTFTPPSVGSQSGNVTIATNASANPSVSLSGTGLGSVVSWTPGSLTFPGQAVNTISSAQALTLSNTGNVAMTITSIATSGAFAQTKIGRPA